jgi:hypothetical protein
MPSIPVSFVPATPELALRRSLRSSDEPLVFRSSAIGPYDDMLNLDGTIIIDLLKGEVEQIEILDFNRKRGARSPANDSRRLFKMLMNLPSSKDMERDVVLLRVRDGNDEKFLLTDSKDPVQMFEIGGGLVVLVADGDLCGFRVSNYYG